MFGQAGQVNYSTAKAGILGMTIVLARELRKYGVTANVVCPRALTRMTGVDAGRGRVHARARVRRPTTSRRSCASSRATRPPTSTVRCSSWWGTKIHLMQGWQMVNKLDRGEGRWTPEELVARKDEIFAGRRSKVPRMGFGE